MRLCRRGCGPWQYRLTSVSGSPSHQRKVGRLRSVGDGPLWAPTAGARGGGLACRFASRKGARPGKVRDGGPPRVSVLW